MKIRVYYEDTDTGKVVYHSNYLNYCERARSEAFYGIGLTPELEDGHFVVKNIVADFRSSAVLGDMLEVTTELLEMKSASFLLLQKVYRDSVIIFEMKIRLAYIDFEGKPQRIKGDVKELLSSLF